MQQPRRTAVTPLSARQVVSVWLAAAVCMSVRYTGVAATAVPRCHPSALRPSFAFANLTISGVIDRHASAFVRHELVLAPTIGQFSSPVARAG